MKRLVWMLYFIAIPAFAIDNLPAFQGGVQNNAVWKMPDNLQKICSEVTSPDAYLSCMTSAMQKANASQQALAMLQLSRGTIEEFKKYNNLSVVKVTVPAADHSEEYYIINNVGDVINVDDQSIISGVDITKAANYQSLAQRYPNISLWFGNHTYPIVNSLPDGIQQLVFTYSLLNGCTACELAGIAKVAFNFDSDGHFLNTQLIELDPSPINNAS